MVQRYAEFNRVIGTGNRLVLLFYSASEFLSGSGAEFRSSYYRGTSSTGERTAAVCISGPDPGSTLLHHLLPPQPYTHIIFLVQ